ncbi:hypothetical protein [Geovibrio ferrireducens]|uniref:hypothetical protein n=1 Tax=Geovibrio ferrireducens TaxID=46201 RepID=UPI0022456CAF|nr:hypothetical protein [Geovibrio ferrireducens]
MKKTLLLVFLFFSAIQIHAGITVSEKLTDGQSVSYFQNGLIASFSDGKLDTLIDIRKKTVYTVDYESEMIMHGTFDDMREMQKLAAAQIQDVTKDDYYKKQNEEIKKLKVKTELKGKGSYAGYPCERVLLSLPNMNISTEICYSKQLLDEIAGEVDIAAFLSIVNNTPPFYMSPEEVVESEITAYASKGFSLYEKTRLPDFSGGTKEDVTVVTAVTKGNIPADRFQLPKGLTMVKMKDLMTQIINQQ